MIKYHSLEPVIQVYIENLDLKRKSVHNYELILRRYLRYLKSHNIKYAKRSDLIHYRDSLWEDSLKSTSVQLNIIVIRNFYKWARLYQKQYDLEEIYAIDIAEGIKGAKIENAYRKEPLSFEQAQKLIEVAKAHQDTIVGARNYAIVILMLVTGLRTIEVCRAKYADISRMNNQSILYIQGKGKDGNDLFVKLPIQIVDAINEYLQMRISKIKYLFTGYGKDNMDGPVSTDTVRHAIKKLFLEAGIDSPKQTPHSLRHTCAYLNLQNGGTLESTQQLLRHVNIETTLIYAHNINRMKDKSEDRIANVLFSEKEGESK